MLAERIKQESLLDILESTNVKRIAKKRIEEVTAYIEQVHQSDDGFITVAICNKKVGWKQYHFRKEELEENITRILSLNTNTYLSINSFYYAKRGIENIRKINSLYLELDNHDKIGKMTDRELESIMYFLEKDYFNSRIPHPNLIISSGRGVHLYWVLEDLPKQGIPLWWILQNRFCEELKDFNIQGFEIDKSAMDLARVFRLPQTKNIKAKINSKVLHTENFKYRLDKIIEDYFPDLQIANKFNFKGNKEKSTQKENKIKHIYNIYQLHYVRLIDIVKLVELRQGKCPRKRELLCFLYRYYSCLYVKNTQIALENTLEFNRMFVDPLEESEVIKATKSAEIAFQEWEKTSQEIGKCKINDKGTYNIKGYNYSNSKLIRILDITEQEQEQLQTIISKKEKYKRNNKHRSEKRRNEDGLTQREQQKKDIIKAVKELKNKGFKQKEVAEQLNKGLRTIKLYWNV